MQSPDVALALDPYHSHADPGLGQVDQQRVLGPALGSLNLLEREVGAVLLKVNLDNQCDTVFPIWHVSAALCPAMLRIVHSRLEVALVLGQQRQRLLAAALSLQDCASEGLHGAIVRIVLGEVLGQLQRRIDIASYLLGQGLCRSQVGGVLFTGDGRQYLARLAEGDLGAELEYAGWELVLWG